MFDLVLFAFVIAFLALGLRRPFLWTLAYLYIDIVAPQKVAYSLLPSIPVSLLAFVAATCGWLLADSKAGVRFTLRQGLIVALLIYCGLSTVMAQYPEAALEKWGWVWKALVFATFLPLTLTSRLRIDAAITVMVLSLATIVINGGIKTLAGGGGYGELALPVRENAGLYEGSILSAVAIAGIPLGLWVANHSTIFPRNTITRVMGAGFTFAALLIPIGTQARTGLVCAVILGGLMLRTTRHRFRYLALAAVGGLVALPLLPSGFTDRMSTIENHAADQSASTRVAVWKWTIEYAKSHPFGGGFAAYLGNEVRFTTVSADTVAGTTVMESTVQTDSGRAFHSSYFEMLGEQGYPGLVLWLWLMGMGLWQMERIRRRWKDGGPGARADTDADAAGHSVATTAWIAPLADALQQAQVIYLFGCLFVGIAFQPFIYMLVGLQIALGTYTRRLESPMRRRRPAPPSAPAAVGAGGTALH